MPTLVLPGNMELRDGLAVPLIRSASRVQAYESQMQRLAHVAQDATDDAYLHLLTTVPQVVQCVCGPANPSDAFPAIVPVADASYNISSWKILNGAKRLLEWEMWP